MQIRQRKMWLFLLILAGAGAVWAGKSWVFVEAQCPHLLDVLLYVVAALATSLALVWALLTKNDAPVVQMLSAVILFMGILIFVSVAGPYLGSMPWVQAMYCPSRACDEAAFVRSLREDGNWEAAAEAARACLRIRASSEAEAACVRQCAEELVRALYEVADPDALPEWGENNWAARCEEAERSLVEAHTVAQGNGLETWVLSIEERQRRVAVACATPTPHVAPTPVVEIEVLRKHRMEQEALLDVRVLQAGHPFQDLNEKDFAVSVGDQSIPFTFEARQADDPVCLIAVVDNSGSIAPGLSQIHDAIEQLNRIRKPGDELGLVVFGAHNDISVQQSPSSADLDPEGIDASGSRTALWDSALVGLETARSCSVDNRYLLLLTDGSDNDSRQVSGDNLERARTVAERAAAQGVSICAVGVKSEVLQPEPLRRAAYGCGYFPAENFDQVATQFVAIFGYVRDFYRLRIGAQYVPSGGKIVLRVMNATEVTIDFRDSNP